MKIIDEGIPKKLKFGKKRDLDLITISSTKSKCGKNLEIARSVLIRNGEVIESECGKKERFLLLSTYSPTNIPMMILLPGELFILFKKLKIN